MASTAPAAIAARPAGELALVPAVEVDEATRQFGDVRALDGVSLEVRPGEVHALLGPNGAGKTTLLRLLTGLATPTDGYVGVLGRNAAASRGDLQSRVGFVPSGDRTFYERLSGEENLLFFARMHGMRRRAGRERARELLEQVDLGAAARRPVSTYSHGMQKRLSVARALLTAPPVLLVDEATHDLDPEGAERIRALVAELAGRGTAVLWATQRVDEIRGFADRVTLLDRGVVRFAGTVPELMGTSGMQRFLLHVAVGPGSSEPTVTRLTALLDDVIVLPAGGSGDEEHVVVALPPDGVLGDVIAKIAGAGIRVLACREERSEIEQAFLRLTAEPT